MLFRRLICWFALGLLVAPSWATRDLVKTFKIRERCAQFDRQSGRAARQSRVVLEMSHEGSEITALGIEGQIRKLFVTHLGTMGSQQETIYLQNERPIWITKIETTYDAPLSGRAVKRVKEWLYFENGRLIQRDFMPVSIVKGKNRLHESWIHQTSIQSPAQARDWKKWALQWQQNVEKYQRALKAKD